MKFSADRPVIQAEVDGRSRGLVLDSGAPALILFGTSRTGGAVLVSTSAGHPSATAGIRTLTIAGRSGRLRAIEMPRDRAGGDEGLLPTSLFRSIYVNGAEGYVVLDAQFQSGNCSGSTARSG